MEVRLLCIQANTLACQKSFGNHQQTAMGFRVLCYQQVFSDYCFTLFTEYAIHSGYSIRISRGL